jgi:hypothetical protein
VREIADPAVVAGLIRQESTFQADALSHARVCVTGRDGAAVGVKDANSLVSESGGGFGGTRG